MASIESEVIDTSAAIERFKKAASELALSRRSFMGMGVAGAAAAGAVLLSAPSVAQQPLHNGYPQVDVLNFLLQVKYVTATLYSYLTTGKDLPSDSGATVGSAQVFNPPKQMTFTSVANGPTAQQLTDMFNEMFYDELSHVVDLRNLIQSASPGQPVGATAVASRANLNLLGNSLPATTPPTTAITMTQSQAIAMSRMLEDLSVSAAAGAAAYLTGTNLAYVSQMMAADGFHAGALRLVAIQAGAQYQPTEFPFGNVTSSAETLESISGFTTAASKTVYAMNLGTAAPSVGNIVLGTGLSVPNSVITAVVNQPSVTPYAIATSGSATLTNVSDTSTVLPGQPITGTGIPANTYVLSTTSNTIVISAKATATTAKVTLTGAT
ncbi:MAG TPA: ferritin-like domain-containing protein, partial [Acidobacteriaceae bacterium]|nr:ferritin-like domain-containing protein [Acidobacteriaceae bacterium]